ncbi:uncharacterized protein LOC143023433 [Oratosquilla oratoria]|uniref:uncharacterized protein LOC143023433 n=1 Tax=Oratosquilla oratoria TaxID=337810 RepID=UPI003F768ED1
MAPNYKINEVTRSLVRIPGNGNDTSARPLCLNLAKTLTNTDGPLGPLVQQCLAQNEEAFRPINPLGTSERPPSSEVMKTLNTPRSGVSQGEKRPCPTESLSASVAAREILRNVGAREDVRASVAASEYLDVWVSSGNTNSSSESNAPVVTSPQPSGNATSSSRPALKPQSIIPQLVEVVEKLKKQQVDYETEKKQLKEEIEILNKKLGTFREMFQNTDKLRAVLKRLNITL